LKSTVETATEQGTSALKERVSTQAVSVVAADRMMGLMKTAILVAGVQRGLDYWRKAMDEIKFNQQIEDMIIEITKRMIEKYRECRAVDKVEYEVLNDIIDWLDQQEK
jgi:hypothetical protein